MTHNRDSPSLEVSVGMGWWLWCLTRTSWRLDRILELHHKIIFCACLPILIPLLSCSFPRLGMQLCAFALAQSHLARVWANGLVARWNVGPTASTSIRWIEKSRDQKLRQTPLHLPRQDRQSLFMPTAGSLPCMTPTSYDRFSSNSFPGSPYFSA